MNQYDLSVLIARLQPFTNGHLGIVQHALEHSDRLLLLIGSANRPRDTRNSFSADERGHMATQVLSDAGIRDRVIIRHLDDHPYDMQRWIESVQTVVASELDTGRIALTGHNRDLSTFYLKKFPQWAFIQPPTNQIEINATAIRKAYFEGVLGDYQDHVGWLPPATTKFLHEFTRKREYFTLASAWHKECAYRDQWGPGPHQCADPVVIQSGHVLLVERGGDLGKGTLAMPGGHLNLRETLDQCVLRELFEETGLFGGDAEKVWPHFRGRERFDDPYRSPRARVITEAFLFKLPDGELPPVEGDDDAARAFWVPLSEVRPENMFEDHGFLVDKMIRSHL